MVLRTLVEAVDLELQPVETEVADQVALECASGDVGHMLPTEVGVDRESSEVGDPAPDVRALEAHRSGGRAVDLDHEDAERVRLDLRALHFRTDLVVAPRPDRGEIRLDLLVGHEVDEEVHVFLPRPAERDGHGRRPYQPRRGARPHAPRRPGPAAAGSVGPPG